MQPNATKRNLSCNSNDSCYAAYFPVWETWSGILSNNRNMFWLGGHAGVVGICVGIKWLDVGSFHHTATAMIWCARYQIQYDLVCQIPVILWSGMPDTRYIMIWYARYQIYAPFEHTSHSSFLGSNSMNYCSFRVSWIKTISRWTTKFMSTIQIKIKNTAKLYDDALV